MNLDTMILHHYHHPLLRIMMEVFKSIYVKFVGRNLNINPISRFICVHTPDALHVTLGKKIYPNQFESRRRIHTGVKTINVPFGWQSFAQFTGLIHIFDFCYFIFSFCCSVFEIDLVNI